METPTCLIEAVKYFSDLNGEEMIGSHPLTIWTPLMPFRGKEPSPKRNPADKPLPSRTHSLTGLVAFDSESHSHPTQETATMSQVAPTTPTTKPTIDPKHLIEREWNRLCVKAGVKMEHRSEAWVSLYHASGGNPVSESLALAVLSREAEYSRNFDTLSRMQPQMSIEDLDPDTVEVNHRVIQSQDDDSVLNTAEAA